jgi:drug/metabolite transporter (DMT)-like permease
MSRRAWIAFAAVSVIWGIPYLFIRIAVRHGVTPGALSFARATMGASLAIGAVILADPAVLDPPRAVPSAGAIASVVVLGVVCTALAFVVFSILITEAGTSRATVITYVNPVIAVALGVTLLGERPGAGAVAGLLLILAGPWLSTDGRLPPGLESVGTRLRARRRNRGLLYR